MSDNRTVIHAAFVLLLPVVVAEWGLSTGTAIALVLLLLLWRWAIVMLPFFRPSREPELVLETISASHFAEKVRWCMDRLGLAYTERTCAGTLGAYYTGRTVPRLFFRTGFVVSRIGNSPEILRYLWGRYSASRGDRARFLEPTNERLDFERRIDKYGTHLQVWVYYHLLENPELCKHVWGADDPATPWWQRVAVRAAFPLQAFLIRKTFRVNEDHYRKVCHRIEELLGDVETRLADGRGSILGGDDINYTDLAFAAISGLWLQPEGYGGNTGLRIEKDRLERPMREDVERWEEDHPRTAAFITSLYSNERMPERPDHEEN